MRATRRVVVGISGGVDSSVSALLLRESRRFDEVIGVFMRNWDQGDEVGDSYTCPIAADFADAERVCKQIDIPLHKADFVADYWNRVFEPYLSRFAEGGTPNPDVFCNKEIKFKCFKAFVQDNFGADTCLATGHYARIGAPSVPGGVPRLLRGLDNTKDQSYFLSAVSGEALRNVVFPVGELPKTEVREIAKRAGLCTAQKKDSVGICFVGKRRFPEFLQAYIDPVPGRFVGLDGKDYGSHTGVHLYTLGQSARIGGVRERMFVAAKDVQNGTITVVPGGDHPMLIAVSLNVQAKQMFWVAGAAPSDRFRALACVRYTQRAVECDVIVDSAGNVSVTFDQPQSSVTPQQIVALYDGEECLGGGVIDSFQSLYMEGAIREEAEEQLGSFAT
mmetsp:Transcript_23379/g.43512  ORF Transcript_23379/g.43512 Transcript_23379/m.43512 type:complete len:390 (-) Transcript_23379:1538-2707(-)